LRSNICIFGTGGQGIITGGVVLAGAAVMDGMYAAMRQEFSTQVRGGYTGVDITLSDETIKCPFFERADIVFCLAREGVGKCADAAEENTLVFLDDSVAAEIEKPCRIVRVPFLRTGKLHECRYVNLIVVSFFSEYFGSISRESVKGSMKANCPVNEENGRALEIGANLAKEIRKRGAREREDE